jgi:hypothetical protein
MPDIFILNFVYHVDFGAQIVSIDVCMHQERSFPSSLIWHWVRNLWPPSSELTNKQNNKLSWGGLQALRATRSCFGLFVLILSVCSVKVKASFYKAAGRGFETPRGEWIFFFFSLCKPSSRTRPWSFTQSLIEMITRSKRIMSLLSRSRPLRRADTLTAICEPLV